MDLIREFWETRGGRPGTKGRGRPSKGRASTSETPKKQAGRGRKRTLDMDADESEGLPARKYSQRDTVSQKNGDLSDNDILGDTVDLATTIKDLSGRKTWDAMIKHVDTVERLPSGTLHIYFTL